MCMRACKYNLKKKKGEENVNLNFKFKGALTRQLRQLHYPTITFIIVKVVVVVVVAVVVVIII